VSDDAVNRTVELNQDGRARPYLLHVPPGRPENPRPLLLELHGRGIDAVTFDNLTGFRALADETGFAVAMPSAIAELWNDGRYARMAGSGPDDVGYLLAVLDDVAARVPIDPNRVYVAGMSNGATMAGRLAIEHAERFAGVGQVAGTAALELARNAAPAGPLSVISIHGAGDRYSPYEGGVRSGLKARLVLRNPAEPSQGVEEWASFWARVDHLPVEPTTETIRPDTTVLRWTNTDLTDRTDRSGQAGGPEVVLYRIEGGGHTWPDSTFTLPRFIFGRTTRTFNATRVIWDFLASHSRRR
jgi:polyhydroxybutyrate depolymerase